MTDDEDIVITSGVSKKTGRPWYAIVENKPSFTFVPEAVYQSLELSGATVRPPSGSPSF